MRNIFETCEDEFDFQFGSIILKNTAEQFFLIILYLGISQRINNQLVANSSFLFLCDFEYTYYKIENMNEKILSDGYQWEKNSTYYSLDHQIL